MQALLKRFGLFGGIGAFAAYAGCCAYMFARQAQLLYQPNPFPIEELPDKQKTGNPQEAGPQEASPKNNSNKDLGSCVLGEGLELHSRTFKKPQKSKELSFGEKLFKGATEHFLNGHFLNDEEAVFWKPHPLLTESITFFPSLQLSGWVDNPGKKKAIIYYGGSSEIIRLRRIEFTKDKKWENYTRYFVPYRGFWPNQQFKPSEELLKNDAKELYDIVSREHKNIFVVGRSLGTSIALHVAANRPVEKLALITPFYSILNLAKQRYRIFPVQRILKDWHEAHKDANLVHNRVHVFLAETDEVTPKTSWEQLRSHFTMPFAEEVVGKSNHTNIVEQPILWENMLKFFEKNPRKRNAKKEGG